MYRKIATHPTTRQIYADRLVEEGTLTREDADAITEKFQAKLDAEFEAANSYRPNKADWLEGAWSGLAIASGDERRGTTAVEMETLQEVGKALSTVPATFNINRKIARQLAVKEQMFKSGEGIDWATGEALAFGTLLREGFFVRLSGQDVKRGTFSQRHAVLIDQENESEYIPLNNIAPMGPGGQSEFEVINSPLSEAGVLGFEFGFSLDFPDALVMWEAQFGDFANGAQVISDQFITSAEDKWNRLSGLVMLLPHGYEGQGPEHSSARLERYLQQCAEDNIQVCQPTTPAQRFHLLRRQVKRPWRKPLVVMTPKSLLRLPAATSTIDELTTGTFQRLVPDAQVEAAGVRRVLFCSGKVYYELAEERRKRNDATTAIVRIEQLYPYRGEYVLAALGAAKPVDVAWVQDEPANRGAATFIIPRLEKSLGRAVRLVSRVESASPATGSHKAHVMEQERILRAAFEGQ
jgi:2-oxoglutarate dehydrogenase E1 component